MPSLSKSNLLMCGGCGGAGNGGSTLADDSGELFVGATNSGATTEEADEYTEAADEVSEAETRSEMVGIFARAKPSGVCGLTASATKR